jgi:tRNA A-37 threonylcarbamoyl transferase component Bud32
VPLVSRYDKYTLEMQDLGRSELITNAMDFLSSFRKARKLLEIHGIRHGDLTPAAVIVKNNKVYLIDFAESRLSNDPRPDKRPEGDLHWAVLTAISLLKDSQFRFKI